MRAPILCVALAVSALGADPRLDEARRALEDGLPQAAIYKLRQVPTRKLAKEDQAAAELLLARALFAAGRFDESASLLEKSGASNGESRFRLAENYAALNMPAKALPLYQGLSHDKPFAGQAAVGAAKMLDALGRSSEGAEMLSAFLEKTPSSVEAALELAEIRLKLGDATGAIASLSPMEGFSPQQQQYAAYLSARALLASGESTKAEQKLREIKDPPAQIAAAVAVALAESRLQQNEAGEAEEIMETYIEENSRLPGLPTAFAALDHIYASEGAASSTELRRWTADSKNAQRSALALFYLARNEARSSKAEKSRQLFTEFLTQYPSHFLADEARAELSASLIVANRAQEALEIAQAGQGFRNSFVRGQAQAALGAYKEAAGAFLQACGAPELEIAALENSAVCALLAGIPQAGNEAMRRLAARSDLAAIVERVRFFEAMRQAAERSPGAPALLRKIADSESAYAQRARLALAEWAYSQASARGGQAELRRVSTDDAATSERKDCLAIFLGDTADRESEAQVAKLAERFLAQYPDSSFEPEVRMKLGEIFYRRGDYLGARGQFGIVAEKFSDSPLAEKAVFLTAQAMARSLDPSQMEEAIAIFEQVVKSGGPLSLRARLAQATLLNALKRPKEALAILDRVLELKPDSELRYTVLIEKGDTFFSQGARDPENYRSAIASWKQISQEAGAPKIWSRQALAKMGAAWEKLGNYDAALDCYYDAFAQGQKGGPEYFWFYKAGFDAGRLLESQKLWKEAIAVYEKLGSVDGPRAEEARDRVNRLRLENFIWDN
ncbi:MAG TPA: tetratricopeptide repeat protein [Terrimicrobiaceae bacterium]